MNNPDEILTHNEAEVELPPSTAPPSIPKVGTLEGTCIAPDSPWKTESVGDKLFDNGPDPSDGELNLWAFWDKNKFRIANIRKWDCDTTSCPYSQKDKNTSFSCLGSCCHPSRRTIHCPTLITYERYIDYLTERMSGKPSPLMKPLNQITFDDAAYAVTNVGLAYDYSPSTIMTIQSVISIVFRFAEKYGLACNIFKHLTPKKKRNTPPTSMSILSVLCSNASVSSKIATLTQEVEKYTHKTKSFTAWQLERLGNLLDDNILVDGRYCLIAIMLYTGIRPIEARPLLWEDVIPFLDHPEAEMLRICKGCEKDGTTKVTMKTSNAYRRIPIHFELQQLLHKRKNKLLESVSEKQLAKMPICCLENQLNRPCRDYEVSLLAEKIFSDELKLDEDDMYVYMLEAEIEKLGGNPIIAEKLQLLTLYVLRRNWFTSMNTLTSNIDLGEKLYMMGHDEKENRSSVHHIYNDENRLWEIKQQMDICIISSRLHQPLTRYHMQDFKQLSLENRGYVQLHLSKEELLNGGVLKIHAKSNKCDDAICLRAGSSLGSGVSLPVDCMCSTFPTERSTRSGTNLEYANWTAHENPTSPARYRKNRLSSAMDATTSEISPANGGGNKKITESED